MIVENQYYDIQVNGYAGVDFNNENLTAEELHITCAKLKSDNVKGILATIITSDISYMKNCIANIVTIRKQDPLVEEMISGFHIEGPFINNKVGFRGAHPLENIIPPNMDLMKSLLESAEGLVRIVTLAPEIEGNLGLIKHLYSNNIIISAGHCNPTIDELKSALDCGLNMFTHLGNGCPQELTRHNNIIQRVLSLKDDLWICFIADGIHIPFYALKNYIKCVGVEKTIIVTDAMAAAGAKSGKYYLGNIELEVGEDRVVREPGKPNFAGSAIDMKSSFANLTEKLSLSREEAYQMTYLNPLNALKKIE